MLLLREPLIQEPLENLESFEVTVTEEHWERARQAHAHNAGLRSRTCPISQALMEKFPGEQWATAHYSAIARPDAKFGPVFEHDGQRVATAFDFGYDFVGGTVRFLRG